MSEWGVDRYFGLERTRAAVHLVMHDVEYEVGANAVIIDYESADRPRIRGPHAEAIGTKSRVGLGGDVADAPWAYFVMRTAEALQEVVQEGRERLFPRCPEHGYHALNAEIASGAACWTCPEGSMTPIGIGALDEKDRQRTTFVTVVALSSERGEQFVRIRATFSPPFPAKWCVEMGRRVRLSEHLDDAVVAVVPRGSLESVARQMRDAIQEIGALHGCVVEFVPSEVGTGPPVHDDQALLDQVISE